jgi:3-deoxy-D-manno-octulosonic-acid transferase
MSNKSFLKWKYFSYIAKHILQQFSVIIPGSYDDYLKFYYFLGANPELKSYVGNLKQAAKPLEYHNIECEVIKPIITFVSLHISEIFVLTDHFLTLKGHVSIIIILRHIDKKNEVFNLLKNNFVIQIIDNDHTMIDLNADIVIIAQLGVVGSYIVLGNIICIGGSFCKGIGGHNALEAAALKKPILYGLYGFNCKDITDAMADSNALKYVSESNLAHTIFELLGNPKIIEMMENNAYQFYQQHQQILKYILDIIYGYLKDDHNEDMS